MNLFIVLLFICKTLSTLCSNIYNHHLKQDGQVALNRSPELCLNLTYRYLLKADHVPGNTGGVAILAPGA